MSDLTISTPPTSSGTRGISPRPCPPAPTSPQGNGQQKNPLPCLSPPNTPQTVAHGLLEQGFWPIAIYPKGYKIGEREYQGKEPIGDGWGLEQWSTDDLDSAYRRIRNAGVGVCLGPGRAPNGGWLIDIEGDGPEGEASRLKLFGGKPVETEGWGSKRGGHQLLIADPERLCPILAKLGSFEGGPKKQPGVYHIPDLPDLELRIGGFKDDGEIKQIQSVCPPTPGTDGIPRVWNDCEGVAIAPDAFYETLEGIADRAPKPKAAAARKPTRKPSRTCLERYGNSALADECKMVAETQQPGRNNQLNKSAFKVGGLVAAGAIDEGTAWAALTKAGLDSELPEWEVRETIRNGLAAGKQRPVDLSHVGTRKGTSATVPPTAPGEPTESDDSDERVPVEIKAGEFHLIFDATLNALIKDKSLYTSVDRLVMIGVEDTEEVKLTPGAKLRRAHGSPKLLRLSPPMLAARLSRIVEFYRYKVDAKGEYYPVNADPTDRLLNAIATAGYYPGIRPLLGITECPYMKADGTIVDDCGYDPETGTYLALNLDLPEVPENPTKADAQSAWDRIKPYLVHFPFESDADRAVILAAMLTAIQRPAIEGPVPGIAVIGNIAGIGKGLLVDFVAITSTGRVMPITDYPVDKEEASKVLLSIAICGKPLIHFDNLESGTTYGTGPLDSKLTGNVTEGRILGESRWAEAVPLRMTCFLTGNNIAPGKDAYRRWLPCNLISNEEHPEERPGLPNLKIEAAANRSEIVRDCLIILKSHAVAGYPDTFPAPLGSFEAWDHAVRGAVKYATNIDPAATRRTAAAESPERQQKLAMLTGWSELPDGLSKGYTVREALKLLDENPNDYKCLRDAASNLTKDGKLPSPVSLGRTLTNMRNVTGGMRFQENGKKHNQKVWVVSKSDTGTPS